MKKKPVDTFTVMWGKMVDDEPYTGTTVVYHTTKEEAQELVKKKHHCSIILTKEGNLGGEWADFIYPHDLFED